MHIIIFGLFSLFARVKNKVKIKIMITTILIGLLKYIFN